MSRVFISPLATPFHSLVSIFPIPSRYISIFRAPPPRYFSPSLKQASSAGHISNTMNVIQEITSQTSAGTTATARSIGNLAKMASEMRNSVSGFKLPEGVEQA